MIEIRHEFEVDGARTRVWELVGNIDAFARCVPTLIEHEVQDDDRAVGIVGVTLGAIPIRSRVDIEVTERRPPERLRGRAVSYLGDTIATQIRKGQPGAVAADAVGRIDIVLDLEEAGERTRLRFQCDVEAEGKLEKIYQSILRLKADALKAELERNVRAALAAPAPARARPPAAASASAAAAGPTPAARGPAWGPSPAPASPREREPSLGRWLLGLLWRRIYRLLIRIATR
ncbi:MAG: hypothetical protein HYY06_30000 [Deltaproteobacteria bacterium]|nr:hypothetical protein [Deltaproteobacteria bacterium]